MSDKLTGKHLYIDCFSGVAGDMFLGAMLDLGVPESVVRDGLSQLPVHGYTLTIGKKTHMGIVGCDVKVAVHAHPHHHHGEDHPHDHGHGRHYKDIRLMIEQSTLSPAVKRRAIDIFSRIAVAESRMHNIDIDEVHFHEVGAVDAIVDVVSAALTLEYLKPIAVTCRPIPMGHGTTKAAHGVLPVPSPAALEILKNLVVEDGGAQLELCTPTGAAIVASLNPAFGQMPHGRLIAAGYGAGDATLSDRPNHLRLMLLQSAAATLDPQAAWVIETNLDDMNPEWVGYVTEQLLSCGALDVWITPIWMKKGRPASMISVLCHLADRVKLEQLLLTETTTLGVRSYPTERRVLQRRLQQVATPYGEIAVKVAVDDDTVVNVAPEYESCKQAAERHQVPLKEIYQASLEAYRNHKDGPT